MSQSKAKGGYEQGHAQYSGLEVLAACADETTEE